MELKFQRRSSSISRPAALVPGELARRLIRKGLEKYVDRIPRWIFRKSSKSAKKSYTTNILLHMMIYISDYHRTKKRKELIALK